MILAKYHILLETWRKARWWRIWVSTYPQLAPTWRRQRQLTPVLLPGKSMDRGAWWAAVHGVEKSRTRLSDFTFTFHFHALEKEMATHSSVLAWRIPKMGEPVGLPSMGSHRVGHDWSDLAAAAADFNLPLFLLLFPVRDHISGYFFLSRSDKLVMAQLWNQTSILIPLSCFASVWSWANFNPPLILFCFLHSRNKDGTTLMGRLLGVNR